MINVKKAPYVFDKRYKNKRWRFVTQEVTQLNEGDIDVHRTYVRTARSIALYENGGITL